MSSSKLDSVASANPVSNQPASPLFLTLPLLTCSFYPLCYENYSLTGANRNEVEFEDPARTVLPFLLFVSSSLLSSLSVPLLPSSLNLLCLFLLRGFVFVVNTKTSLEIVQVVSVTSHQRIARYLLLFPSPSIVCIALLTEQRTVLSSFPSFSPSRSQIPKVLIEAKLLLLVSLFPSSRRGNELVTGQRAPVTWKEQVSE